jgi:glycosyltransferase involved in cell wall biosynthesis
MPAPFWSVMIPTYRTEPELLRGAIESVLENGVSADGMEIIVVNDGAAADVAVCEEKFDDRVTFVTNDRNLGATANFNECIRRAGGDWVHILHADDAVRPGFYETYAAAIAATPGCVMVGGQAIVIDADGMWCGVSPPLAHVDAEAIATRHPCNFASTIVRRDAYQRAGGFDTSLVHAADWEMWTRLACAGPVAWVATPHAYYRRHAASDSARLARSAAYVEDLLAGIAAITAHFPPEAQARVRAGARMVASDYVLGVAAGHLAVGRRRAAVRDAWQGFRLRPNLSTLGRSSDTIVRAVAARARATIETYG